VIRGSVFIHLRDVLRRFLNLASLDRQPGVSSSKILGGKILSYQEQESHLNNRH